MTSSTCSTGRNTCSPVIVVLLLALGVAVMLCCSKELDNNNNNNNNNNDILLVQKNNAIDQEEQKPLLDEIDWNNKINVDDDLMFREVEQQLDNEQEEQEESDMMVMRMSSATTTNKRRMLKRRKKKQQQPKSAPTPPPTTPAPTPTPAPTEPVMLECFHKMKRSGYKSLGSFPANEWWYQDKPKCMLDWQQKVLLMHVGKAGGGSVHTVANHYHVKLQSCHPQPKDCKPYMKTVDTVMINIRDPVDRFVSAFNWRGMVFCNKDHELDPRPKAQHAAVAHPDKYCKIPHKKSEQMEREFITNTYAYNVNNLAEAMCNEGPKGNLARLHAGKIQHAGDHLTEWLEPFLKHPALTNIQQIIAVVLESREYSFDQTIDDAMRYLMEEAHPGAVEEAPWSLAHNGTGTAAVHTSVSGMHSSQLHTNPTGDPVEPISALGECCIARHLRKQYDLIKVMAGEMDPSDWPYGYMDPRIASACHWGRDEDYQRCVDSLKHMLERRAEYLTNVEVPCDDMAAERRRRR